MKFIDLAIRHVDDLVRYRGDSLLRLRRLAISSDTTGHAWRLFGWPVFRDRRFDIRLILRLRSSDNAYSAADNRRRRRDGVDARLASRVELGRQCDCPWPHRVWVSYLAPKPSALAGG